MNIGLIRFSNVPMYEASSSGYVQTGGPITGPRKHFRTRPWKFTKAHFKIMEVFGESARAGLKSDVRMGMNTDGVTALWGEIEVPRNG